MLILARHGATELNELGRVQGSTNRSLSTAGAEQARRLAAWLVGLSLTPPRIYTSKAARATETARILSERLGTTFSTLEGLHERDFGQFEGVNRQELLSMRGLPGDASSDVIERWADVPGVESDAAIRERALPALEASEVFTRSVDEDVIIVSHSGIVEVLLHHVLGIPGTDTKWIKIPPGSSVGISSGDGSSRLAHLWPNPMKTVSGINAAR